MENVNSQCLITMAEHSPRHGITILANLQYWETLMISERTAFFLNAPKTHLYARFFSSAIQRCLQYDFCHVVCEKRFEFLFFFNAVTSF